MSLYRVKAKKLSAAINSFLSTCSQQQRNIFVRRYWYFDPVSDICRQYSLSQSTVKTTLFRMREKLKLHLNEGGFIV